MCLSSVSDLTANMVEPRVLTPHERLEALLMAASIESTTDAYAGELAHQPTILNQLERGAKLLRKLVT